MQSGGCWEGKRMKHGLEGQNDLVQAPFTLFQKALSAYCMPGLF